MQHDRFNEDGFAFSSPVAPEQLPAKQYRDLKARRFFRWAVLKHLKFTTKLLAVWIGSLLLVMLVVAARSANSSLAIDSYIASMLIVNLAVSVTVVQLRVAWHDLYYRLIDQKINCKTLKYNKADIW